MIWNPIAKAWTQFTAKALRAWSSPPNDDGAGSARSWIAPSTGDVREELLRAPYKPSRDRERDETSLHLSC